MVTASCGRRIDQRLAPPHTVVTAPGVDWRASWLAWTRRRRRCVACPYRISIVDLVPSTIAFPISMPVSRKPDGRHELEGCLEHALATVTASGTVSQITAVWRRPLNITITATTIAAKPKGAAARPALVSTEALCSPCHPGHSPAAA